MDNIAGQSRPWLGTPLFNWIVVACFLVIGVPICWGSRHSPVLGGLLMKEFSQAYGLRVAVQYLLTKHNVSENVIKATVSLILVFYLTNMIWDGMILYR